MVSFFRIIFVKDLINYIFGKERIEFDCFGDYPENKMVQAENDCFHCEKLNKCMKITYGEKENGE
jgi:hypothetical protein